MALRAATQAGLTPDKLRSLARVDLEALDDPDGRIAYGPYMRLWELAAAEIPGFGILVAESFVDAASLHVVGFAARNCSTFVDSIMRAVRFIQLVNENTLVTFERKGKFGVVTDGPRDPTVRWPTAYNEFALGAFAMLGRKWTGRDEAPLWTTFHHPKPAYAHLYARVFGEDIRFAQPKNQVAIRGEMLDAPIVGADDALRVFLDRQAEALMKEMGGADPLVVWLRRVVAERLPSGALKLEDTARCLSMSARTLQRRLSEAGTRYDVELDGVRKQVALAALSGGSASVADAAFLAGYNDTGAFRDAVRRWTGKTPAELRRASVE